ncbi:MAG TPA: hypothetical protein VFB36_03260 [Nevskiaceae bacterium]|nr:hypothetical protein [Nevskiaceae bacterium]
MSRLGLAALAAQLCVLAGCAEQPYQTPIAPQNPWADAPQTPVAAAAPVAPEAVAQPVAAAAPVYSASNPNVGGTRHGAPVAPPAPAAPTPPPAPVAAAAPAAPPAPAPVAKPAKPHHAKKAAPPAKPSEPAAPVITDAKAGAQAPLRTRPALESAGKQILGVGAPLRLVTQLENDAGTWWYVETESGAQGWLRASEIQR